jgi:uncharacterized protein HemX
VKAVNGCTPGSASNEVSATTTGGVVTATPTPAPAPADTASDNSNQNVAPTDTPTPEPTVQPTATPTPAQTLVAGTSKTKMLVYIIIFILAIGGIGWFIYWQHEKNVSKFRLKPDKPVEETNSKELFNK